MDPALKIITYYLAKFKGTSLMGVPFVFAARHRNHEKKGK